MPRSVVRRVLVSVAALAVVLAAGVAAAQSDAARVTALLRELKNPDFDRANAAASALRKYPQHRQPIVTGLIDAVRTGKWNRCGGDMRDAIAHHLGELKATEAVVPLIEVVKSGKSIEHECAE